MSFVHEDPREFGDLVTIVAGERGKAPAVRDPTDDAPLRRPPG